jgi:hypothetical protein
MILELIHADHRAGREVFAVAGNSTFEATDERKAVFDRFSRLWSAHDAMMNRVVYPEIEHELGPVEAVANGRGHQKTVEALIADLAARADASNDQDLRRDPSLWFADFERLKDAFERQCAIEAEAIVPLIQHRLGPERIGNLTRAARELRANSGI